MKRILLLSTLWIWSVYAADFKVSYRTEPNQISGQYMHNIYIVALQNNLQIKDVIVNRGNCRNSFGLLNASSAPRTAYPSVGTKVDVEDVEYLNKYKPKLCEALKSHKDEKVQQFKQEHFVKAEDIREYIKGEKIGEWLSDEDVKKLTQYYFDFIQKAQKETFEILFDKERDEARKPHIVMGVLTLSNDGCYLQRPNNIPKVLEILEKERTDICQDDSDCSHYVGEYGYNSLGENVIKEFTKCEQAAQMLFEETGDCETTIRGLIGNNHRIKMVEEWKKRV